MRKIPTHLVVVKKVLFYFYRFYLRTINIRIKGNPLKSFELCIKFCKQNNTEAEEEEAIFMYLDINKTHCLYL